MESIIYNQPIINIGCLGSVSDGKSTLVEKLTGIHTQQHSQEKHRNITIKQGYANMKVWADTNAGDYYTTNSHVTSFKNSESEDCKLVNHISFVDCPGHQSLIQTMLLSISLMNGAIVVVAVNEPLSGKPQLIQHLAAAKLGKLDKIIVCMNKIDLVSKEVLLTRKQELDELLERNGITPYAVIPTCFNKKIGLDHLTNAIMKLFNPSEYIQKSNTNPIFRISRTFDINLPGKSWNEVSGGVFGGSLHSGSIKQDDVLEIRPGLVMKTKEGKFECIPFKTKVLSIESQKIKLNSIISGGLVSIATDIDPYYFKNDGESKKNSKKDGLVGHVVGTPGHMPSVFSEINTEIILVSSFGFDWKPTVKDMIVIQIGTRVCDAIVKEIDGSKFTLQLAKPCCIGNNEHIIICRLIDKILRIVGEGTVKYHDNPNKLIE
jgi:small GTP-binding protein